VLKSTWLLRSCNRELLAGRTAGMTEPGKEGSSTGLEERVSAGTGIETEGRSTGLETTEEEGRLT